MLWDAKIQLLLYKTPNIHFLIISEITFETFVYLHFINKYHLIIWLFNGKEKQA